MAADAPGGRADGPPPSRARRTPLPPPVAVGREGRSRTDPGVGGVKVSTGERCQVFTRRRHRVGSVAETAGTLGFWRFPLSGMDSLRPDAHPVARAGGTYSWVWGYGPGSGTLALPQLQQRLLVISSASCRLPVINRRAPNRPPCSVSKNSSNGGSTVTSTTSPRPDAGTRAARAPGTDSATTALGDPPSSILKT